MKGLGRGKKRLEHNAVDLIPGIQLIQTDSAFTVNGRKHTHTHTQTHTHAHITHITLLTTLSHESSHG